MPRAHARVTWGGDLGTQPGEQWSCSLSIAAPEAPPGIPAPAWTDAQIDALVALVQSYHQDPKTGIRPLAKVSWVKYARLLDTGRYDGDAELRTFQGLSGGATAGTTHPFQVARAVTLHTGRRGASYRGRFFLPLPNNGINGDGTYAAAEAQDVAVSTAAFLTAIDHITTQPGIGVVVAGAKGNIKVTGCTVGVVLDTIRSRRTSLKEAYGADVAVVG